MTNAEIYELISNKIPKDKILVDEPMSKHTSFKIGGKADFYVLAKNVEEVKYVVECCKKNAIPLTIVGNGSNLLVKDNGIRGITLRVDIDKIEINKADTEDFETIGNLQSEQDKAQVEGDNKNNVVITVGAGVLLGKLAFLLLKNSISGFECFAGIPGTIGGAVRMNAGAYGGEFKDIVIETTCMDKTGNIVKFNNKQQQFAYRSSIFKQNEFIILESKLLLKYVNDAEKIKVKMNEYKESRMQKQPIEFPSAGSTFKRGSNFITAKLIDECGLKGYSIGGAQVSTKHSGFIINNGNATAKDVLELIKYVQNSVQKKFDKEIQLEVEVIGE